MEALGSLLDITKEKGGKGKEGKRKGKRRGRGREKGKKTEAFAIWCLHPSALPGSPPCSRSCLGPRGSYAASHGTEQLSRGPAGAAPGQLSAVQGLWCHPGRREEGSLGRARVPGIISKLITRSRPRCPRHRGAASQSRALGVAAPCDFRVVSLGMRVKHSLDPSLHLCSSLRGRAETALPVRAGCPVGCGRWCLAVAHVVFVGGKGPGGELGRAETPSRGRWHCLGMVAAVPTSTAEFGSFLRVQSFPALTSGCIPKYTSCSLDSELPESCAGVPPSSGPSGCCWGTGGNVG